MRIDSSYVGMESARKYTNVKAGATRLRYGRILNGDLGQTNFGRLFNTDVKEQEETAEDVDSKQDSGKKAGLSTSYMQGRFQPVAGVNRMSQRELSSAIDKFREQCMRYIFELLFGREKRTNRSSVFEEESSGQQAFEDWMQDTTGMDVFTYEAEFVQTEQETTAFSTVGTVKTADGRKINFHVDVEMSRSFTQYYKEQYQVASVRVCDPLVINLDTDIAELSDQKFFFDLDADGTEESVSFVGEGSGFLALDKNGDGQINDGTELFGTKSGDGFADLAAYDADKNGWIDENDEVFSRLKVWTKDADGNNKLVDLKQADVGAIFLGKVGTEFSLNRLEDNQTNGMIRSTGVYLKESTGAAFTVQHVDLAL